MSKSMLVAVGAICFGFGCGTSDAVDYQIDDVGGAPIDAPEFAGFVNQNEQDEYCLVHPEHMFCGDLGVTTEAWKSAEYHGVGTDGKPCYSSHGTNGDCAFPVSKQMRIIQSTSSCFDQTGVSLIQIQATIDGFNEGLLDLYNTKLSGSGVSVVTSGGQPTTVSCVAASNIATGLGGLSGTEHAQIANLPVGPSGQDEARALQDSSSFAQINPTRIKNLCPSANTAQVKEFAHQIAIHEGLHALGFMHFTSGVMKVDFNPTCNPQPLVLPNSFWNAMHDYNGSTSGGVTITQEGLPNPE